MKSTHQRETILSQGAMATTRFGAGTVETRSRVAQAMMSSTVELIQTSLMVVRGTIASAGVRAPMFFLAEPGTMWCSEAMAMMRPLAMRAMTRF